MKNTETYEHKFLALPEEVQKKLKKSIRRKEDTQIKELSSSQITDILKEAQEFAMKWNKLPGDVWLERHTEEDYGYTRAVVQLELKALESDEQYYQRLVEEDERSKIREEYERKEFERLKAKFNQ